MTEVTKSRLAWLGIVVLVAAQCVVWVVAGSILWSFRDLMVGAGSPQATENARFAVASFSVGAINALALLLFMLRPHGWGWSLLFAVQLADLAITAWEGFVVSEWWWLVTVLAALMIACLHFFRRFAVPGQGKGFGQNR